MKNKGNQSTKIGFGKGVCKAAGENINILVIGADITASVGLDIFAQQFPERFFSIGIAEQNCIGVAAGMALAGKIPVFSSYAAFSALRTTDQIRVSLCYNNLHAIIGGAHSGVSVGPDGATHQALEDIAIMRVLPHMTVISPCDATQAETLTYQAILKLNGPVYIRYGKNEIPDFTNADHTVEIGKGQQFFQGDDVCIIATGSMVWEALKVHEMLKGEGISAGVVNIHTIKPIDENIIIANARHSKKLVCIEEHQISGGLGSAVAEITSRYYPVKILRLGMQNCFGESGNAAELLTKYHLTAETIIHDIIQFVKNEI